jgi:hypothetical protein
MPKIQTPILRGNVKDGELRWHGIDGKRYKIIVQHLEGKEYELTLRSRPKKRSLNQNSYYWGVVIEMLSEASGYEPEEMHDALKERFLRIHAYTALPTVRSTTDLTTVEFEEYMRQCRQLSAEMFGLYIPEPNEVLMEAVG